MRNLLVLMFVIQGSPALAAPRADAGGVQVGQQRPPKPCGPLGDLPYIHGREGNDRLYGSRVAYRMFGDEDRDFIIGTEGGEVIGGSDADTLISGGGADRFVYNSATDSLPDRKGRWSPKTGDTIVDFRRGDGDRIDLGPLPMRGANAPSVYQWSGSMPEPYSVWAMPRAGDTIVLVDSSGDALADIAIRLLGEIRLSQEDFCGVETS